MALADWLLPYQLQLMGGPVLTPGKPPSASNIPGHPAVPPPQAGPFDFTNAMTSLQNVQGENQLRAQQARQAQIMADVWAQSANAAMQPSPSPYIVDQSGGGSPASAPFAMGGASGSGGYQPTSGIGAVRDPRGVMPMVDAAATKYGIDPGVARQVSMSEGAGQFYGDGGTSGGAFQLHVTPGGKGNAVGDQFQRDTGLDPLDPKNEAATIDYAMRYASLHGWGAWNGAKRAGIGQWQGILGPSAGTNVGSSQAPGAPSNGAGFDLAEGDSIGVGFKKYGGLSGNPIGGRNPQAVMDNINANLSQDPNYYRGKNVILSSGTMNDPKGEMSNLIPQQIAAIQQAGGRVTLAGADTGNFSDRHDALAGFAKSAGIPFAGALPTDNVHPGPAGYKSYLAGARPTPTPATTGAPPAAGGFTAPPGASLASFLSPGGVTGGGSMPMRPPVAAGSSAPFAIGGGAPAVPTPPAPQQMTVGGLRVNPQFLAWAQAQDRLNALMGRRNPVQVDEALRMQPGGSLSPQYLGAAEAAKANAQKQPEAQYAGQIATAQQNARVGPEIAIEQARPRMVPGVGLVIPSQVGAGNGAAGANGTAPNGSAGGQPGVSVPVMTPAQEKVLQQNLTDTQERLKGYHSEGAAAVEQVGNAAAITDLLGRVRLGWNANTVQQGARILSSLGVPDQSVSAFLGTDPSAGDALNKLFLQFSSAAVRQMGAREPGSVISLFAKSYPNLETQPHAAELMTNALRMQAQWKQDRANAAEQWALDQQRNMGNFGQNYRGLLGFEQQFANSNNPRDYWRAAAAMSNEPSIAWQGLSADQKQRVFGLIPAGTQFRGGDGKLYLKPGAS
jgi:hypothetical protein